MKQMKLDQQALLDFQWDWEEWLGTDTISSHTVTGTDCTVVSSSATTTTVTAWISTPTSPTPRATCHITTAAGRQEDRTIVFILTDR